MVSNHKVIVTLIVVLMAVSGCGEKEAGDKSIAASVTTPAVQQPAHSTSETSLAFYEANLDKAKSVWAECQKTGPDNMSETQKKNCANAQQAWMYQPYKPSPAKFSSSGGRH